MGQADRGSHQTICVHSLVHDPSLHVSPTFNASAPLGALQFLRRLLVLIGHFWQLVCDTLVAINAGQACFEPFSHGFCRGLILLVRIHGCGRVAIPALV